MGFDSIWETIKQKIKVALEAEKLEQQKKPKTKYRFHGYRYDINEWTR